MGEQHLLVDAEGEGALGLRVNALSGSVFAGQPAVNIGFNISGKSCKTTNIDDIRVVRDTADEKIVTLTTACDITDAGNVSPPSTTSVFSASPVLINACPNPGYSFSRWTTVPELSNLNPNMPSTVVSLDEDTVLTAKFVETDKYLVSTEGNGFIGGGTAQNWQEMDSSWPYDLPFTFNFYGKDYTRVYVATNGFLSFNSGDVVSSEELFLVNPRISPYSTALVAFAFPEYDIFIHQPSSDSVCFRWQMADFPGNKVNFEAILHQDGSIKFNYGVGNNMSYYVPLIGVSAGDGVNYTLISSFNAKDDLSCADSWVLTPNKNTYATLTVTADPPKAGNTFPSVPLRRAEGICNSISAYANSNYKFLGWIIKDGDAIISDFNSSSTEAAFFGDTTLIAKFAVMHEPKITSFKTIDGKRSLASRTVSLDIQAKNLPEQYILGENKSFERETWEDIPADAKVSDGKTSFELEFEIAKDSGADSTLYLALKNAKGASKVKAIRLKLSVPRIIKFKSVTDKVAGTKNLLISGSMSPTHYKIGTDKDFIGSEWVAVPADALIYKGTTTFTAPYPELPKATTKNIYLMMKNEIGESSTKKTK